MSVYYVANKATEYLNQSAVQKRLQAAVEKRSDKDLSKCINKLIGEILKTLEKEPLQAGTTSKSYTTVIMDVINTRIETLRAQHMAPKATKKFKSA